MKLQNKVYIVTGGSRGFGFAIAKALIEEGANVGLISRNADSVKNAVEQLGAQQAYGCAADVANASALASAFADIKTHFGRLDGLINNAGMARPNTVENLVEADVIQQINTNFLGTVFASQAAIPLLRGGENPRIINISSASAYHRDEMSHLSIYAASKAAVERFTRDLVVEVEVDNIGVTCIRPGAAETDFAMGWNEEAFAASLAAWRDTGPHMRIGMQAQDMAQAVVYALNQPKGVSVDLLEIRPHTRVDKL